VKRVFDIILSFLILLVLSPFLILISLFVFVYSGFPILYSQKRVGKEWKEFQILKFRTMVNGADKVGSQLSSEDDVRITPMGRFLRKYKLDELPQFINVIKGDMSIVGPRPEVFEFAEKFKKDFDYILKVKPGISDFASIKYRNEAVLLNGVSNKEEKYIDEILPEKIDFSKQYIRKHTILLDFKIILLTIFSIVR